MSVTYEAAPSAWKTTMQAAGKIAGKALLFLALAVAWLIQYVLYVPMVWTWRAVKAAFKIGGLGVLLVFIPIIGWIILAVKVYALTKDGRQVDRRYLHPWGVSLLSR